MSFKLSPANTQTLLGLPGSATMTRAGFASKTLWVTEYNPEERWVGGKYPLQNPHPGGVLEWVKQVLTILLDVDVSFSVLIHDTSAILYVQRAESFEWHKAVI